MLESISLKFTENEELVIDPAQGVIVFVGPNNSGKSLILRELETAISGGNIAVSKLLNDFEIIWPSPQQTRNGHIRSIQESSTWDFT